MVAKKRQVVSSNFELIDFSKDGEGVYMLIMFPH